MSAPRKRRRFTWTIEVECTAGQSGFDERLRYCIKGPATPAGAVSRAMTALTAARRERVDEVHVIGKEPFE